ncbi:L-idonate 5-dehydrogenase [Spatholobus suberectus]|nr:L-idonate 5-dehydrogenase [Spatholobus suberectus]
MLTACAFGAPWTVIVDVDDHRLSVAKSLGGADDIVKVSTNIQIRSQAEKDYRDVHFHIGDWVYLKVQPYWLGLRPASTQFFMSHFRRKVVALNAMPQPLPPMLSEDWELQVQPAAVLAASPHSLARPSSI